MGCFHSFSSSLVDTSNKPSSLSCGALFISCSGHFDCCNGRCAPEQCKRSPSGNPEGTLSLAAVSVEGLRDPLEAVAELCCATNYKSTSLFEHNKIVWCLDTERIVMACIIVL
jgi:hypothetical protein